MNPTLEEQIEDYKNGIAYMVLCLEDAEPDSHLEAEINRRLDALTLRLHALYAQRRAQQYED